MNILVVDDVPSDRKLLRARLLAEGMTVFEASDGVEALAVLDQEKIEAVISDILMPRMDGYLLCHHVRQRERLKGLPFIFLSATYASPSDERFAFELGADKFVKKPCSASELLAALWEGVAHAQHSPESPARSLQESEVVREYSDRLVAKLEHQHLALLAAHEQMRLQATALATAANAIIITDHAGRILWVNPAFTVLTGYTEKEAIGNTPRLLKSDRHDAAFYREFWNVILSGRTWHGEFTNRRKDGTLYYDQCTVTPVLGESGEITHFIGVTSDVTARKLAEEEIRKLNAELEQRVKSQERTAESLNLFRMLIDRSNDAIEVIDPETACFLDVNEKSCQSLGYTREEMLVRRLFDIEVTLPDLALWSKAVEEVRQSGFKIVEGYHRRKDGSTFPVEVNVKYVELNRGYLVAVVRDITERKRAEEALLQRSRLTTLGAAIGIALNQTGSLPEILRHCSEALVANLDAAFARIWTLNRAENMLELQASAGMYTHLNGPHGRVPVGQLKIGFIAQERKPHLTNSVVGDPRVNNQEWAMREGMVGFAGYPLLIEDHLVGVMALFARHPISEASLTALGSVADSIALGIEHKWSEEELRESEQRLRAVLDSALDAIITIDHEGKVVEFNPAAEKTFGRTRADAIGREMAELIIPPAFRERHRRGLAHFLATKESPILNQRIELAALRADGAEFPIELSITRIGRGEPPMFTGFIRDITQRKQLEEQFRQAQKMEAVGQLAGGVAHDFNNILTIISGHVSLLGSTEQMPATSAESVREIALAADRAAGLTRQLLTFSRQQPVQLKALDMAETINNLTKMLHRLIGENISLRIGGTSALPPVFGDVGMIEQLLVNLVVNARDAMPRGGELTVTAQAVRLNSEHVLSQPAARPGDFIRLSVADTGTGIAADVLPKIFEAFFTTKPVGKGTGLGLATVQSIAEQHQGWVDVESQVGHGTTFHVYLPTRPDLRAGSRHEPKAATPVPGGKETLLIVEDESSLLGLMRTVLERRGYRVLEAKSGIVALDVWKQHRSQIDLVITDMLMPDGMTGRELVDELRLENPLLKALFVSGYSSDIFDPDFFEREGKNFLQKPYTPHTLVQLVRQRLDR